MAKFVGFGKMGDIQKLNAVARQKCWIDTYRGNPCLLRFDVIAATGKVILGDPAYSKGALIDKKSGSSIDFGVLEFTRGGEVELDINEKGFPERAEDIAILHDPVSNGKVFLLDVSDENNPKYIGLLGVSHGLITQTIKSVFLMKGDDSDVVGARDAWKRFQEGNSLGEEMGVSDMTDDPEFKNIFSKLMDEQEIAKEKKSTLNGTLLKHFKEWGLFDEEERNRLRLRPSDIVNPKGSYRVISKNTINEFIKRIKSEVSVVRLYEKDSPRKDDKYLEITDPEELDYLLKKYIGFINPCEITLNEGEGTLSFRIVSVFSSNRDVMENIIRDLVNRNKDY